MKDLKKMSLKYNEKSLKEMISIEMISIHDFLIQMTWWVKKIVTNICILIQIMIEYLLNQWYMSFYMW